MKKIKVYFYKLNDKEEWIYQGQVKMNDFPLGDGCSLCAKAFRLCDTKLLDCGKIEFYYQ